MQFHGKPQMKPEPAAAGDTLHLAPTRKILFNISCALGFLIFLYYGFSHLQEGYEAASRLNFIYAGCAALVLLWVNLGGSLALAQNGVLALLIPLFCLMLVMAEARTEGLIWIVMYPMLAFFYKGRHEGMKWLGALIAGLLLALACKVFFYIRSPFPPAAYLILIACLLAVAVYMYAYDTIRSEAEQTLKLHTLALDEANRKLVEQIGEREAAQQKVQQRTEELSELNLELKETVRQLARLNADKNELMSMIAHDLRNPLAGALMTSRHLERQENLDTAENRRRVGEVTRSIQYTMKLINNFLGLKAIETGQTELVIGAHDLSAIVADVAAGYRGAAEKKGIELVSRVAPARAYCDPAAATEVVENLISNALKFSPSGTHVDVSLGLRDDHAVLIVRDQGPGISEQDQRNMYKMFGRLSARPTAGEESIGLGLSITKKLVEMMAGRIHCESAIGQGAAFIVELPLASLRLATGDKEYDPRFDSR